MPPRASWLAGSKGSRSPLAVAAVLWGMAVVPCPLVAQVVPPPPPGTPTVTVTPGAAYEAGSLYRTLLGGGYRSLWTTPIRVPVADLSTIGGGLTPTRLGGGMTTRTLHLDGADGRRYVFRSVDKTPTDLLEDFEGSPLESIIQDQISSFHPTGAPVVARLLDAVGVLHPEPTYMVVPDDPRLGEFREAFAGLLVLVEERPDDGPNGRPGFAGSRDIEQTDDLFEELEEDPGERVDAEEFLRARLVDLLVGDRDRSHNNLLWARFDREGGGHLWRVIPRDRDQAFVRFDGQLKAMARRYDRRLVTFGEAYPDIFGLTRNAWDMDRMLLVDLERAAWDRVVREVRASLTDEAIAAAVRAMPREHVALIGAEMETALRARRDHLAEAADVLYRAVFRVADIQATDVDEVLRVAREPGGVTVTLARRDEPEAPFFRRRFADGETAELRVYLHGGDDRAVVTGRGWDGPRLRIIGGGGADAVVDDTEDGRPDATFYDPDDDTDVSALGRIAWKRREARQPYSWFELRRELDWGASTVPEPRISYDADRGLLVVAGLRHARYGFLKRPFAQRMRVRAGWAFGVQRPLVDYRQLVRSALGPADLHLGFRWSGIEILNWFGLGNETTTDHPTAYHRVTHEEVTLTAAVSVGDGERRHLEVGPTFTYTSTDTAGAATLIADDDPYGSGGFAQVGLRTSFAVDARDAPGTPTGGYLLTGGGAWFPGVLDATRGAFGEAHGQAAAYLSPPGGNPVLAVRGAGKKVWGSWPFTGAAFLGGPASLRGLREQRYAGDAMLLGSAELRVDVGRMTFPVPTDVGILVLADVGRVFYGPESSSTWHSGVGGGLWFALVNRSNLVQVTVARSEGGTRLGAGVGFAY